MNLKSFFQDRRVQFGVGVFILFLVGSFIFKDNVRFALAEYFYPPTAEDKAKAGPPTMVSPAFLTILDMVFSLVAGLGGWFIAAVGYLINKASPQPVPVAVGSAGSAETLAPASPDDARRQYVIALGQAALDNDPVAMEEARVLIRRPRAIQLLAEAHSVGDIAAADVLQDELKKLSGGGQSIATTKKRGAASNG